MGMGSLTLACVLLTVNAGPEPGLASPLPPSAKMPTGAPELEPFHMKSPSMKIPINIDPMQRDNLSDIVLLCSTDEGNVWTQVGHATPDKTAFPFTAPGDGQYWFTIQTIDKKGVATPLDPKTGVVGQKIIVDTVKPAIHLTAERKGDEIVAKWEVTEDYPERSTFALEYQIDGQPSVIWKPIPAAVPGATGLATFKPEAAQKVTVKLRVKDKAGNEGIGLAEVPTVSAPPPLPPPNPQGENGTAAPWAGPPHNLSESTPPAPLPPGPNNASGLPSTLPPPVVPSTGTQPMRGALPPRQLINKPEVKLDFDVTNLGPSGFGTVDVFVTMDEGANWTPLPIEPSAILPPEMRGLGQARGSVQVHVPEDGKVFGFYLVVKSRAMLGKPPPHSGDVPHIRLERDMLSPAAKLKVPQPDPTRRDTLILTWEATDKNLADKPISLEWAPRADGPWEFIGGSELPNTGRFSWQVPPTAPPSVYLKLTVRDGAGNVTVAQSDKPVVVDLSVPEVAGVSVSQTH